MEDVAASLVIAAFSNLSCAEPQNGVAGKLVALAGHGVDDDYGTIREVADAYLVGVFDRTGINGIAHVSSPFVSLVKN